MLAKSHFWKRLLWSHSLQQPQPRAALRWLLPTSGSDRLFPSLRHFSSTTTALWLLSTGSIATKILLVLHNITPLTIELASSTLVQVAGLLYRFGFIAFLFSAFPTSHGQEQECCPFKTVENSIIEKFNGAYTLVNYSQKRKDTCNDGCIYEKNGLKYCFVFKPGKLAHVVCKVGKTRAESVL